jgi:hypothetical protein
MAERALDVTFRQHLQLLQATGRWGCRCGSLDQAQLSIDAT